MDDQTGQAELQALFDVRRRFVAAFEDIATGVEAMASHMVDQSTSRAAALDAAAAGLPSPSEMTGLQAALDEERTVNAQLEERVRVLHARGEGRAEAAEAEAAQLREQLEALEAGEASRRAEMDALLSELIPLLEEAV